MKTTRMTTVALALLMLATIYVPTPALAGQCGRHTEEAAEDCTFACEKNDQISVSVTADDQSWGVARAIGNATCGNASAACNEEATCSDDADEKTTAAQEDGSCHGETDEIIHDGFSYECKSVHFACVPPECGPDDAPELVEKLLNTLCTLVPQVCTQGDPAETVLGLLESAPGNLGEVWDRCGFPVRPTSVPPPSDPDEAVAQAQNDANAGVSAGASCAGVGGNANLDPVTGLPPEVRSRVRVSVAGTEALGEVCNAGVGCWFVFPACERNIEGIIRGCTVDASSLRVDPEESLKLRLVF